MTKHFLEQVLLAEQPNPGVEDDLMLFGQFEGAWNVEVTWLEQGRAARKAKGEWHFGWILDGRAIQDVWIVPTRLEQGASGDLYEYGTSIRFYDARIAAWRSTWIGPVQGSVRTFIARRRGDEIVLEGMQGDGRKIEWIFSDIGADRFQWRFQVCGERGWEIVQAFVCTRMDELVALPTARAPGS